MKKMLLTASLLVWASCALGGKEPEVFYPGVEGYVSSPDITCQIDKSDPEQVTITFGGTTAKDTITFTELPYSNEDTAIDVIVEGKLKCVAYKGSHQGFLRTLAVQDGALSIKAKKAGFGRIACQGLKSAQVYCADSIIQDGDGYGKGAVVKAAYSIGAFDGGSFEPYFTGRFKSLAAETIGNVVGNEQTDFLNFRGQPLSTPKRLALKSKISASDINYSCVVLLLPGTEYKAKNTEVLLEAPPDPPDFPYAPVPGTYLRVDLEKWEVLKGLPAPEAWTPRDLDKCIWFVKIPAGKFAMGSPGEELGRNLDEKEHQVTLTKGFWLAVFELTESQFARIYDYRASRGYAARGGFSYDFLRGCEYGARFPMSATVDYNSFLNIFRSCFSEQYAFDLPTEAQWEYACKAGTHGTWNDGSAILSESSVDLNLNDLGWYSGNTQGKLQIPGRKKPNAWGLFDMHGNALEPCLDWYQDAASVMDVSDPLGPISGTARAAKGGDASCSASRCRSAWRGHFTPDYEYKYMGLRLCLPE